MSCGRVDLEAERVSSARGVRRLASGLLYNLPPGLPYNLPCNWPYNLPPGSGLPLVHLRGQGGAARRLLPYEGSEEVEPVPTSDAADHLRVELGHPTVEPPAPFPVYPLRAPARPERRAARVIGSSATTRSSQGKKPPRPGHRRVVEESRRPSAASPRPGRRSVHRVGRAAAGSKGEGEGSDRKPRAPSGRGGAGGRRRAGTRGTRCDHLSPMGDDCPRPYASYATRVTSGGPLTCGNRCAPTWGPVVTPDAQSPAGAGERPAGNGL